MERVLGALPVARPGGAAQGRRRARRRPFHRVVLADVANFGTDRRFFRYPFRRADPAPQGRLPRHRHAWLRRDRADRCAQHAVSDERLDGPQWRRRSQLLRLPFRRRFAAVLLCRADDDRPSHLRQLPAQGFAGRPRLDGNPRGRDRRRGNGRQPGEAQAACFRHRCRVCRLDRHPLRRQTADGNARDVHVPGLGHDPGDDRARRHGQRRRRRARRSHPGPAAELVPAGFDAMGPCARPPDRRRLAAARRAHPVDRADLRHHPGLHDAISPAGADPCNRHDGAAELRGTDRAAVARRDPGGAERPRQGCRSTAGHAATRDAQSDQAFRRYHRGQGTRPRRHAASDRRADRSQRLRQIDFLQRRDRPRSA